MKQFLIPAIALAAVSVAVPAMAQNYGSHERGRYEQNYRGDRYEHDYRRDHGGRYEQDRRGDRYEQDHRRDHGDRYERDNRGGWQSIAQRKYQLDRRIDAGLRNGQLSRREGMRLRTELNTLVRLEYSYQRGGLSARERADLDYRYDRLAAQVRAERRDRDGRRHDDRRY